MANVDPLSSLTAEEMAKLLREKQAAKQVMASRSGFNPAQYAPTYGAEQVGMSPDHYDNAAGSAPFVDRPRGIGAPAFTKFEGDRGKFNPLAIAGAAASSKFAAHESDRVIDAARDLSPAGPGKNIPEAGVPLRGMLRDKLAKRAYDNALQLGSSTGMQGRSDARAHPGHERKPFDADGPVIFPTSQETAASAIDAYNEQADVLGERGMTPGQRQDIKTEQFDTVLDLYLTRVVPNLERTRTAEDKANLPILKQALEPNQTLPQFINTISQDWRVLANLVISSVAKTPEAILAGTIGAVVGTMAGNPVLGAAIGIGGGAGVSEVMIGFNDALATVAAEANFDLDMQTEEGLRALLARPDLLGQAEAMNQKRAGVVGSGMFLSTLFAGKIASAMYKAGFRSSAITAAVLAQGVGEGGTEAGAQVLSGEMAAKGGLDYGSIFSETVASLATAGIPITAAVVKARGERKQLLFNLMQDDINNGVTLPPELQDHFNDLQKRLIDKFPHVTWDDDVKESVSPKTFQPIINQGRYDKQDKRIHLSLKAVILESDSAKDALNRAESLATRHERVHQVAAWNRARGNIEDDPIKDFLKTNRIAIGEWIKSSPAYEDYLDGWNNGDEAHQLAVAEEYLAAMSESDTGLKGKVKLWALRVAKKRGWDIDASQDARTVVQDILDRFKDVPWAPFDSAQAKQSAVDESGLPETRSGGLQSQSRRDFMRKMGIAGAGVAIDPSLVLEPGGIPPAETVAPQFSGFGAGPSAFPEMEGVLRAAEADAMPTTGLVSQQTAFDDFNPEQALEEERIKAQKIEEFENNQAKEKKAIEDERAADQENFIKAVEEVISIYGADAPITEDLKSGKLNERIKAIADETGYPEAELSRAVQNYIEDLTETETEVDMFANIARKNMTPGQLITRNFNNFVAKRGRAAMKGDAGKLSLLDRLRKIAGAPATKLRGGEQAAETDKYIELARQIAAGDTKGVVAFLEEQEGILTKLTDERTEVKRKLARADYAASVNKDVTDLSPRRGNIPPYEKFISPKLAMDMAQQQFDDGKITAAQLKTIKGKVGEAQTTIKTNAKLKRAAADALAAEGITLTGQELEYWSEQAEIVGPKQVPAQIEVKQREKTTTKEFADSLDAFIKSGGTIKKLAPGIKIIHETGTSNARRIMSTPWIDTMADPNANTADFGEVEIEGESFDGFSIDDEISPRASVVRDNKFIVGNVAKHVGKVRSAVIVSVDEDTGTVTLKEGNKVYDVPVDLANKLWTPTADKSDTVRNTKFKKMLRDKHGNKTIRQLSKKELGDLVLTWYDDDNTQIPDKWKRTILPILFGKKVNNEIAAFIKGVNKTLGRSVMATDHSVELDQFFTPNVVKALIKGEANADVTARAAELLSETNLTFMPQFLNNMKKSLRLGSATLPPSVKARREKALDDWYEMVYDNLTDEKSKGFVDAHMVSLKQWVDNNADVFPEGTIYHGEINRLKDMLNKGVNVENFEAIEALYKSLREPYLENLRSKGAMPTSDENLVNSVSTAVKSGLEFNASVVRKDGKGVDMPKVEAHFTSSTLYNFLSFSVGRVTFAVDAFNRESFLGGSNKGDIPAAAIIANLVYRNPAASGRPEGMEAGTDMVQELSLRTGEFQSKLSQIFSKLTNNEGVITPEVNAQMIDYLAGKEVTFKNKEAEAAAKELQVFMDGMYKYAKGRTGHLENPLDLRGAGDTVLPRVWNTQYIATKEGKEKFLKTVADKFTDPEGKSIFEEIDITPEDLYTMVVNSGGFVQGDWRQNKQDQTTSTKEVEKGELIQEYLDSLTTEELVESGLIIDDLQAILPRFINKAVQRAEYSAIFGTKDEILRSLIQAGVDQIKLHNAKVLGMGEDGGGKIIDEKQFKNKVWDMSNVLRGKYGYESVDLSTRRGLQMLSNAETVAKLPLVMLASLVEFGVPLTKGSANPAHFAMELGMATAWAGYKAANGVSKLVLNKHLPAMLKHSSEIGGLGIIRDIQLLREMGIADIQAMGDVASTRYVNPSFAPGGIKSGARSGIGGRVPKSVRAVFNMQTFMQATMLTTLTEMQQFMALRNFQRHMGFRMDAVGKSKSKTIKGKRATNRLKQYKQDMLDYGLTEDVDLSTEEGQAAFRAATLRFVDQVITRPNDATTAKIFRNPLTAPLVLFKRFITTYGNTLLTSIGRNMADKVDNVERAKQGGKMLVAGATMYGGVMFAEMMRAAIKGDLEDEDFEVLPNDFKTFLRRVDRMGVLGAPGALLANLAYPSKAWYGDTGTNRMVRELTGPLGSDMAATLDYLMSDKKQLRKLLGQIAPTTRYIDSRTKKKTRNKRKKKGAAGGLY